MNAKEKLRKALSMEAETGRPERNAEELSAGIAEFLADSAANSLAEIIEVITDDLAEVIIDLLDQVDPEMFVRMLQAVFSMAGMEHAADQLELLKLCSEYDENAYCCFQDEFMDNDSTEPYFTEQLFRNLLPDEDGDGKRR